MMTLVIGGSASGKSEYAEGLVMKVSPAAPRIYIATMEPFDKECLERIKRHRAMRAEKSFETLECYTGLEDVDVPAGSTVLLECMSNLCANEMYSPDGRREQAAEAILEGVERLRRQCGELIVVSNEVFSGGMRYEGDTPRYLWVLAQINRELAAMADNVCEIVSGIPVYHKGGNTVIIFETIAVALAMFSALPVPQPEWNEKNMRYAMCAFPLVGVVIALAWWGWAAIAGWLEFPTLLRAAGFCLLPVLITGGIHLDGYADTSDALASWTPPERRQEILQDTHCGAFAVIRLCTLFAASFALCGAMEVTEAALWCGGLSFVLSRSLSGLAIAWFPLARNTGLAHTFATAAAKSRTRAVLTIVAVLTAAALCALGCREEELAHHAVWDVQELAAQTEDLAVLADRLAACRVVIATETGGGIVPADAEERAAREAAGQLSCLLAQRAETVVRVFCGIPTVLKGQLP